MASVSYNLEHKVNMGDYEHVMYSLRVSVDNVDDYPGMPVEQLVNTAKLLAVDGLKEDIEAASDNTQKEESFIHLHPFNKQ